MLDRADAREDYMLYHKLYFLVSIVIGVFQIIDGVLLVSLSDIGSFSLVFSISGMLWVIFSIVAIFKVKYSRHVPITYTAYNVFGWAYGVYLAMNSQMVPHGDVGNPPPPVDRNVRWQLILG